MEKYRFTVALVLSALLTAPQVFAERGPRYDEGYFVHAKVVSVEPVVRVVQVARPREVCWDERVRHVVRGGAGHQDAHVPVIVGGVVGGIVGNRIAKKGRRGALTVAGTIVGAAVGHGIAHHSGHVRRPVPSRTTIERHCETETRYHEEERVEGYDVTYKYHGRRFVTRTSEAPGKRMRVWVQVEPAGEAEHVSRRARRHRITDRDCDDGCFDT